MFLYNRYGNQHQVNIYRGNSVSASYHSDASFSRDNYGDDKSYGPQSYANDDSSVIHPYGNNIGGRKQPYFSWNTKIRDDPYAVVNHRISKSVMHYGKQDGVNKKSIFRHSARSDNKYGNYPQSSSSAESSKVTHRLLRNDGSVSLSDSTSADSHIEAGSKVRPFFINRHDKDDSNSSQNSRYPRWNQKQSLAGVARVNRHESYRRPLFYNW